MAGLYRRLQAARDCVIGTYRGRQAEPQCSQGSLRRVPNYVDRPVQERPAVDRECRSGHGDRAGRRSCCCPASDGPRLHAWPSQDLEGQCRCDGSGCYIRQTATPVRARGHVQRQRRWRAIQAWAIGAFWHGPQVTSASQSPCAGLVAPEVSHAATLAWTHSILHDPSFTTVWQASFRALCLSFDLGTLQPRSHHDVERSTSRPALGSSRQVKFNPNVSVALGLDDDWTLRSFEIQESSLSTWTDKPWSGRRFKKPLTHRNADERIFPLQHLPQEGQTGAPPQDPPVGPFLDEAPQSIQDLFQVFLEEDLIEGEELNEPVPIRSWYVHHRRVPECIVPRFHELQGHWRFWAADILSQWDDQISRDDDVALALVFPNPPRDQAVMFDLLVIQGLDLPRRACLATVIRLNDPQQRAERSLAISLPHLVSAKYIAARAHLVQDCHVHDCTVRHGRTYLTWNDVPAHDARDGQSFIIRRLPDDPGLGASTHPAASSSGPVASRPADGGSPDESLHADVNRDLDLDYDSNVSMASTPNRQSVFVYRLAAPTTFGHADWSSHNSMIASLARIAEVPLDQVVTAHHLQCQLPDQPPHVAAVILQHVQDIQPASTECLIVIDLELHAHPRIGAPPVPPHSTRQVHRVYPLLRRANILQLARVDAYCEWVHNSCLVFHNDRGWPILELAPRFIQHGAHFKVMVPPPPDGHGDTAHAVRVAREAADLFDFPMASQVIPGLLLADNHASAQAPAAAPADDVHVRTCRNGEDQEFDDFPVSEASQRPAAPLRPDVDWSNEWMSQLAHVFRLHGMEEVLDGPAYLYLQTWYIHHDRHLWCRHPRPVRLTNEAIGWSFDLRQTLIDLLDPHIAVTIRMVQPTPPQSPLQSYSAHLILEQARPPGRSAVVVSALFESLQGNALMQFAKSMPRHVTANDVIQESELVPHCSVRPCSVWVGPRQVNVAVATAVDSGTGLRIHLRPLPYEPSQLAQPPYQADGMHAEPSLLTTPLMRADGTHFIEDEPPDNTIDFLQRRVLALQRNLRTVLAVSSGAAIQPGVVEGPVDGPAVKHPLQLESLIPHHSTVIKAPCHKVAFFANHLLTIDIGAIQPFASVVKWHDPTLVARASCPDWNYEAPLRIWFYTDGASSLKIDSQQRCASASAVLIIETAVGLKFGGFRTCTVPAPATAPFAEHVALQLASLWCIQLHEWCRWAFGLNGIQTTFVFDCLAAGHAAHGSWCCTQHAALHHRTRALQHWIESRYSCTPAFIHVHSHRGDPWNEAADAICWATLHDWIPGVSFDELCHQQLVPFDDVVPWLWYWQRSLQGAVGYPDVCDGFFNFSFQHVDAPFLDSSTHSFCQVQQDDSAASQQTATLTLRAATANVLTLYSNQAAHGHYISARHEALMHEFHHHGAHLVGVQETRSRLTGHHAAEHYHVIAVPALANGHGGLQLWIAKVIEVGSTQLLVRDSHLRVLQQSVRHLIVRISVDGLKLVAIVGHVPCMPDVSAAAAWWKQILQGLPPAYQHWPRIMMVDANARVGSLTSAAIGPHQASTENEHGEMMHQWMIDNGMFAPQTFDCHHIGSASTFAHAKGPEGRIDFVLVDEALRHPSIQSFVTDIDLATQRPDHFAVAVDIPITMWHRSRRIRRQPDVAAVNTAGAPPQQIPWNLDVHSHAALLHQWLRGWQPKRPHLPRKKHLTPDTWNLVQTKAFHWKRSRQIRATLHTATLRAIFDAWRTCDVPLGDHDASSQWQTSQMDLAWHLDQHRRMGVIVTDAVRRDDIAFFESFAQRHNDEALPTLWKTLKPLLPRACCCEKTQQLEVHWPCNPRHCATL